MKLTVKTTDALRLAPGERDKIWFDDDIAFSKPWGFEVSSIQVPVLLMHGEQDLFVPYGHGLWLAEHIPEVDARLSAEDGHLTLPERRIGEVHAWLVERFVAGGP